MTAISQATQCLSSLRNIEASLSAIARLSKNEESIKTLYSAILAVNKTAENVEKRMEQLKQETCH